MDNKKKGIRTAAWILFAIYAAALIKLIVFKDPMWQIRSLLANWSQEAVAAHLKTANFIPFHSINLYIRYYYKLKSISFNNLVYNVVAFIPWGIFVPYLHKKERCFFFTFLTALLFSASIEAFQLVSLLGECDVDDLILNVAGAVLGYLVYRWMYPVFVRRPARRKHGRHRRG